MHTLRIAKPENDRDWSAYHAIRRSILWEARGLKSYRADHPDELAPGHYPMIFLVDDEPIGVVRVDLRPEKSEAVFRRVAIKASHQRKGYGRRLMSEAEDFARAAGCKTFIANVALDAVPFYSKLGYNFDPESPENNPHNPRMKKDGRRKANQSLQPTPLARRG